MTAPSTCALIALLASCCVHRGVLGSNGGSAAYQTRTVDEDEDLSSWTLAAPRDRLDRMVDIKAEMEDYKKHQSGAGETYGNSCGFAAAARLARFYGGRATRHGYPANAAYTSGSALVNYLQRNMRAEKEHWSNLFGWSSFKAALRKEVAAGRPPIMLITLGKVTKMHWVVVVGFRGNEVMVADWNGLAKMTAHEFKHNAINPILVLNEYCLIATRPLQGAWGSSEL